MKKSESTRNSGEVTHSELSESGVWGIGLSLGQGRASRCGMEGVGEDYLVVLEGSWASVCREGPTVLGASRYLRGLAHTCAFSPSEFPGSRIARSYAGVPCLVPTPMSFSPLPLPIVGFRRGMSQ